MSIFFRSSQVTAPTKVVSARRGAHIKYQMACDRWRPPLGKPRAPAASVCNNCGWGCCGRRHFYSGGTPPARPLAAPCRSGDVPPARPCAAPRAPGTVNTSVTSVNTVGSLGSGPSFGGPAPIADVGRAPLQGSSSLPELDSPTPAGISWADEMEAAGVMALNSEGNTGPAQDEGLDTGQELDQGGRTGLDPGLGSELELGVHLDGMY